MEKLIKEKSILSPLLMPWPLQEGKMIQRGPDSNLRGEEQNRPLNDSFQVRSDSAGPSAGKQQDTGLQV